MLEDQLKPKTLLKCNGGDATNSHDSFSRCKDGAGELLVDCPCTFPERDCVEKAVQAFYTHMSGDLTKMPQNETQNYIVLISGQLRTNCEVPGYIISILFAMAAVGCTLLEMVDHEFLAKKFYSISKHYFEAALEHDLELALQICLILAHLNDLHGSHVPLMWTSKCSFRPWIGARL